MEGDAGQSLLAQPIAIAAANDPRGRQGHARRGDTSRASQRAPQNPQWPGFLAEIQVGYAELATTAADRATAWQAVRDLLEPLAKAGHLPASRKALLDRARAAD